MPVPTTTEVQHRATEAHPYDKAHAHDPHLHNKNWVHREALQLALGSILTPKRPQHSPHSLSTSGSLSPAYSSAPHTPGTGTPVHPHYPYHHHSHHTPSKLAHSSSSAGPSPGGSPNSSSYPSPTLPYARPPMMLTTMSESDSNDAMRHAPLRGEYQGPPSPGLGPIDDSDPRLKPVRPTLTPLQPPFNSNGATNGKTVSMPNALPTGMGGDGDHHHHHHHHHHHDGTSGQGTPKAKFFEALQGKSAWDALIHGSFS